MNSRNYYDWVAEELVTNKNGSRDIDLLNYTTGMTEEFGEIYKIITKSILHSDIINTPDEREKLLGECGDYLWYMTAYHILIYNSYKMYKSKLNILFDQKTKFLELNPLLCDNIKLQGLYRKIIFLNRPVDMAEIESVYNRCFNRFYSMIKYFGFTFSEVMTYNKAKLDKRYPNGRESQYFLELAKRTK